MNRTEDLWITVDELPTESMKVRWICDDGIEDIGLYDHTTKQFSTIDMNSENPILYWKPFNL